MSNRFFTCKGTPEKIIRKAVVQNTGAIEVVKVGVENQQAYIDSFEEQTKLTNIIQRFLNGDTEALNANKEFFGDFTTAPRTLAEAMQRVIDAEQFFNRLPTEVKQKFDNDFHVFLSESQETSFLDKVGLKPTVIEKEVNEALDKIVPEKGSIKNE